MVATVITVYQDDVELEEINNAWLDRSSRVFATNAVGGEQLVNLTYELKDNTTDVRVVFAPLDEYDENQELTIQLN